MCQASHGASAVLLRVCRGITFFRAAPPQQALLFIIMFGGGFYIKKQICEAALTLLRIGAYLSASVAVWSSDISAVVRRNHCSLWLILPGRLLHRLLLWKSLKKNLSALSHQGWQENCSNPNRGSLRLSGHGKILDKTALATRINFKSCALEAIRVTGY